MIRESKIEYFTQMSFILREKFPIKILIPSLVHASFLPWLRPD